MSLLKLSSRTNIPIRNTRHQWHALRLWLCLALASFLSIFAGTAAAAEGPVLSVASTTARMITLTWPGIPGAINYKVHASLCPFNNGSPTCTVVANPDAFTNAVVVPCLNPSTTYYFQSYATMDMGGGMTQLSSMSAPISAATTADTSTPTNNVALACGGGLATASNFINFGFYPSAINNGETKGYPWGGGGGWNDKTADSWPDWVQVDFNGAKKINRIVVYTLQDNYGAPVEPTNTMTFTKYGIQDYQVQYWNGSSWVKLAAVTGNNLVKRTFNFTAVTTSKIRVYITKGLSSYSRVVEVEAIQAP